MRVAVIVNNMSEVNTDAQLILGGEAALSRNDEKLVRRMFELFWRWSPVVKCRKRSTPKASSRTITAPRRKRHTLGTGRHLRAISDAWPELNESTKARIVAMVRAGVG